MTTENTGASSGAPADVLSPESPEATAERVRQAAEARARDERIKDLIRRNAILKHRLDACKDLVEETEKQLHLLLNDAKVRKVVAYEGTATFTSDRCFEIISVDALMRTFTKEQLAQGFKPTATFVDAAAKAGINVGAAIRVGTKPGFEVRRSQTKAAREQQERIIEETRRQLEVTVDALAATLRTSTQDEGQGASS